MTHDVRSIATFPPQLILDSGIRSTLAERKRERPGRRVLRGQECRRMRPIAGLLSHQLGPGRALPEDVTYPHVRALRVHLAEQLLELDLWVFRLWSSLVHRLFVAVPDERCVSHKRSARVSRAFDPDDLGDEDARSRDDRDEAE